MMGFFRDLFDVGCPNDEARAFYYQRIAELEKLKGLGKSFEYLGRKCIVTAHHEVIPTMPRATDQPLLKFEYADDNGVIRTGELEYEAAKSVLTGC